jgi:hypothetical protein
MMSEQTDVDDDDMPMFHDERARQCKQGEQSRLTPADGGALDDAAQWLVMAASELDDLEELLGGKGRQSKPVQELLTSISYALFEAHAAVTLVGDPDYAEVFGRPARGDVDVVWLSEVRRRRDGDRPDDAA